MMKVLVAGMLTCLVLLLVGGVGVQAKWYVGDDLGYLDYVTVNGNQFDNLHDSEVVFYNEDLTDGKVEIRGILESAQRGVMPADLKVQVSLDGGKSWADAQGDARWSYIFVPQVEQAYRLSVRVVRREMSTESQGTSPDFVPLSASIGGEDADLTHLGDGVTPKGGDPRVVRRVGPAPKPTFIPELEGKILVPLVAHLEVILNNYNVDGNFRWSVGLLNIDAHESLEGDRYELRVVQVLDLGGQTVPAGLAPVFEVPSLTAGGTHGFGSGYTKHARATKLQAEIWDTRASVVVARAFFSFTGLAGQLPSGAADIALLESAQLQIKSGEYLGRGLWSIDVENTGDISTHATAYEYTWIYRFASGVDRHNLPRDLVSISAGQTGTILNTESMYDPTDGDCDGLRQVDVLLTEKATGVQQVYAIPVHLPVVTVDEWSGVFVKKMYGRRPVYLTITNNSNYNLLLEASLHIAHMAWPGRNTDYVTRAYRDVVVPITLPANQTVEDILLENDLFELFQIAEDDQNRLDNVMRDWWLYRNSFPEGNFPHFDARLTIRMGVNTKCGEHGSRALFYHTHRVPLHFEGR